MRPAHRPARVAAHSLCDRPTRSSSTRPSTASWSRCGTRRKSISGCWPALVERGSGAVQLTDAVRFCGREGAALAGGKPTTTSARRAKKRMFRSVQYPCPRAAITRCPAAERCRSGWSRPVLKKKHRVVHKKDLKDQADYAKINSICPVLRLRCRQPGDRFRPAGRGADRELRKWMNEAGIPPRERDTLPLLAAGRAGAVGLRRGLCRWAGPRAGHRAAAAGGTRKFWRNRIMSMHDDILKVLVSEEELKAKGG